MIEQIYIIRHGGTEWSKSGRHTGRTDLPLTEEGIQEANSLAKVLNHRPFSHIFCSPLIRAKDTCKICGYLDEASITESLLEWNYGDFEGKTIREIHAITPQWNIFAHGAPNGESVEDVTTRVDQFLSKIKSLNGTIAFFSSGHISRAIAARWVEHPLILGKSLALSTAALSMLGYEHGNPVLLKWNIDKYI